MTERRPRVAVVGAGLSGTLVTANLLRHAAPALDVVLIERSGDFGPGVAYSTTDRRHLLNVPVARMSAFPGAPLHFLTWARRRLERHVEAGEFLSRAIYGEYLRTLLADERARATAARVELRHCAAETIERDGPGVAIGLADGTLVHADAAVLATGSPPGQRLAALPDDPRVVDDPWARGALDGLAPDETTVILGTSLTAIDLALSIAERAPAGRTLAVSRRGLVPHAHLPGLRDPAPAPTVPAGTLSLDALEGALARHARHMVDEGFDWRDVIDGIRPCVPVLWSRLALDARRRFLRERVRDWDVRRHRVAPEVGARLEALRSAGRLDLVAGTVAGASARRDGIELVLDGAEGSRVVRAGRVICATGAGTEIARAGGLVGDALQRGLAAPDSLGLGLTAGRCGALIDRDGGRNGPVYTLGPPRRGELWETTAAREISVQAQDIGLDLCSALGVGRPSAALSGRHA